MPLDEAPNLVSLHLAVARGALDELYRRLAAEGYEMHPGAAVVFQHIRPGGSPVEELARLGHATPAAVEEQAQALEAQGYVRREGDLVDLTDHGRRAVEAGLAALASIEARWREILGDGGYAAFASGLARLNLARYS